MTSFIDAVIGTSIIAIFFFIIGSKIWDHEKEHLRPLVRKVKGWFEPKEDEDMVSDDDFDIRYKGHSNF